MPIEDVASALRTLASKITCGFDAKEQLAIDSSGYKGRLMLRVKSHVVTSLHKYIVAGTRTIVA